MTVETYIPQTSGTNVAEDTIEPTGFTYGQDIPKTQNKTDYDI